MKTWEYLVVLGGCAAAFLFALFRKKRGDTPCEVMSKQVNSQWKFKVQKFSYRSLPNVLRTSILLNKLTRKLRDVQAVRGGVLWEPAGLKTGSAAGAFFR